MYNKISFLIFILIGFGCTQQKPEYIYNIPDHDSFAYSAIDAWPGIRHDTTLVELWHDSRNEDGIPLFSITDIMETSRGTYWITDMTTGKLSEFDAEGNFLQELFRSGRGPSELIRPVSLGKIYKGKEERIYILDTDQQIILVSDADANETQRYHLKDLPNSFGGNKLTVISENELIWPTYREDYVLSKRDTSGIISENYVERLIPPGFQPTMHNNVAYDIANTKTNPILVYAYQGLPLIMVIDNDDKKMINLKPKSELKSLNTTLEQRPLNESVSVSVLIREVFFKENTIWVAYQTNLYEVPLDKNKEIIVHSFVDHEGELVRYQPLFFTGSDIFLVNFNSARIYKVPLSEISSN